MSQESVIGILQFYDFFGTLVKKTNEQNIANDVFFRNNFKYKVT